jgi:Flp pilus assembly pilin Flp
MKVHVNSAALRRLVRLVVAAERGQTLAEYGPLVAAIAVVVLLAAIFLGSSITSLFENVSTAVSGL